MWNPGTLSPLHIEAGVPMWRQVDGFLQRIDEHLAAVVIDLALVVAAATLITLLVRAIVV
jgi:hypothetical protein